MRSCAPRLGASDSRDSCRGKRELFEHVIPTLRCMTIISIPLHCMPCFICQPHAKERSSAHPLHCMLCFICQPYYQMGSSAHLLGVAARERQPSTIAVETVGPPGRRSGARRHRLLGRGEEARSFRDTSSLGRQALQARRRRPRRQRPYSGYAEGCAKQEHNSDAHLC